MYIYIINPLKKILDSINLRLNYWLQQGVYFTLGGSPISELIGFGDTAYRGIGTPFQSPAQNTPPAVSGQAITTYQSINIKT